MVKVVKGFLGTLIYLPLVAVAVVVLPVVLVGECFWGILKDVKRFCEEDKMPWDR